MEGIILNIVHASNYILMIKLLNSIVANPTKSVLSLHLSSIRNPVTLYKKGQLPSYILIYTPMTERNRY